MPDAARTKPFLLPSAIAAAVLICGFIGFMIESRANILRTGTEIVLETAPIDPRDLLRGRYVTLAYPAERLEGAVLEPLLAELEPGQELFDVSVYVTFEVDDQVYHQPVGISLDIPDNGMFIQGTAGYIDANLKTLWVDFGIGRFYTNEQRAPELEARMRDGVDTDIVLAVGADGRAQIKALRQNDETILVEPLY